MMQRGILRRLRGFRRDRRGAIAAMFAAMFPVVFGIVALGVETGVWFSVKRHHQAVADVAAIAGATELMNYQAGYGTCTSGTGPTAFTNCAAAADDAKTNGFDFADSANSASSVTLLSGGSGDCPASAQCVQVILKHQQGLMTAGYFLSSLTIGNQAVAAIEANPKQPCATAFGGNSKNSGIILTGTSSISMKDCMLATNSTSTDSVQVNGNAGLDLFSIYSAGGISFGNNCANNNCTLTYPSSVYQPPLCDPYDDTKDQCGGDVASVQQSPANLSNFPTSLVTFPTTLPTAPMASPTSKCPSTASAVGSLSADAATGNTCYQLAAGNSVITLTGGTFVGPASYYFSAPVLVTGAVTIDAGVNIYVTSGSFTVASTGSLTFADNTGGSSQQETIAATGSFDASLGTVTFTGDSTNAAQYAIYAGSGSTFGTASFGDGSYGFYGGGLAVAPPSGTTDTFASGSYYVDAGDFAINGAATFAASTSTSPATIQVMAGNFTNSSSGTLTFTGGGTSQYDFCFGKCLQKNSGSAKGILLSGPATFGSATYYVMDQATNGIELAAGASATFQSGLYAVQNGNFTVDAANGTLPAGSATFDAGTFCTPTGSSAASCIDIANGGFVNAGTTTFASGDFYIIDGPIGGSGGFENTGTLKLTGGNDSNYYFFNGASYGTSGVNSGKCAGSNAGSGVYGALSVMGGSTASFGPGNYYLVNGDLCMHQDTSNSIEPTVNCLNCSSGGQGITFILTNSGGTTLSSNIGTLQIPAPINTKADPLYPNVCPGGALPPCSASPYAGLLVYQDRNAPLDTLTGNTGSVGSCQSNCSQLAGGSDTNMTGAIYMPEAALTYGAQSGSASSAGKCLLLLVDSLTLTGGATLSTSGCQSAGVANSTIKYVTLVQ